MGLIEATRQLVGTTWGFIWATWGFIWASQRFISATGRFTWATWKFIWATLKIYGLSWGFLLDTQRVHKDNLRVYIGNFKVHYDLQFETLWAFTIDSSQM